MQFGDHVLLNTCWQFGMFIAKWMLAIWQHQIAKCMLAIWQQPIAKHSLAIMAASYRLKRNDRVGSFYWTRGSKLCFSHVSLILVATFIF